MAKEKPFNNPFEKLKMKSDAPAEPAKPVAAAPPPKAKKQRQVSEEEESKLFLSAMGAFDPVKPVREPARRDEAEVQQAPADDGDTESLLELAELVVAGAELVVEQTASAVTAYPKGLDLRLLGRIPPAVRLDLQALAPDRALPALERFIVDAQVRGERSVQVTTGAPLRARAIDALTRGKLARKVLAFSGTADTLDVLLRR